MSYDIHVCICMGVDIRWVLGSSRVLNDAMFWQQSTDVCGLFHVSAILIYVCECLLFYIPSYYLVVSLYCFHTHIKMEYSIVTDNFFFVFKHTIAKSSV